MTEAEYRDEIVARGIPMREPARAQRRRTLGFSARMCRSLAWLPICAPLAIAARHPESKTELVRFPLPRRLTIVG